MQFLPRQSAPAARSDMTGALLRLALVSALIVAAVAPLARAQAPIPPGAGAASSGTAPRRSFTDAIPCTACHSTTAWRASGASGEAGKFDHSTTGFPLTGEHIHTSCV